MATPTPNGGNTPPPKPWERAGSSSGPAPFKPSIPGRTTDVVEASGTARPGEIVSTPNRTTTVNVNAFGKPLPARPWVNNFGTPGHGGYGPGMNYNPAYNSGMYNPYGGGMYNRGGYGGHYGPGMYNMGGPHGVQDPNSPFGEPTSPPGFWISLLRVMHGVVNFFGRIAMLIDQNTQAFHMFMSALLMLFDRSGLLYGELAGFALRILGVEPKPKEVPPPGPNGQPLPGHHQQADHRHIKEAKPTSGGSWDNLWGNEAKR